MVKYIIALKKKKTTDIDRKLSKYDDLHRKKPIETIKQMVPSTSNKIMIFLVFEPYSGML